MERDGQEMAANELPETVEYKRKDFGFPLKSDDHLLMESPVNGLSRFAPLCPATSSMNEVETETGMIVEDLTLENYKNSSLVLAKSSNNLRKAQRERMYRIESRSEHDVLDGQANDMLLRAKEQLARMSYENHKIKDIDQTSGGIALHLKATEDNLVISSNTLSVAATRLKTSSRPSFSQFFVNKGIKGKGVIRREHHDQPCLPGIDNSGTEPSSNGISLREWLKPGSRKEDKVESLIIFRQIVELVDSAHSQGVVLQDLRPSCFSILSSNKVIYTGLSVKKGLESAINNDLKRKSTLEHGMNAANCSRGAKQLKHDKNMRSPEHKTEFTSPHGSKTEMRNIVGFHTSSKQHSKPFVNQHPFFHYATASVAQSPSAAIQVEERWYACPGELNGRSLTFSSNIYSLGVFLFELLCRFESMEQHSAMMSDLSQRILPPNFLSESPKEAAFCLWLLHPEPLSRPTTREILDSDLFCGSQERFRGNNLSESSDSDMAESEILLHFLTRLEEKKQKHASKLIEEVRFLEEDIKEAMRRQSLRTSSVFPQIQNEFPDAGEKWMHFEDPGTSVPHYISNMMSDANDRWLSKYIRQLEHAYFSMRSKIHSSETAASAGSDKDLLKNRDKLSKFQNENGKQLMNQNSVDPLGSFFDGLCKFASYNKFEVCGTIRNRDILNSANVICTLSFDRNEDYIATAGISKRIKIFEFDAFLNDSIDIHYPVVEMSNKSKISCVCWNNYIKNYLASTDYDGVVQTWDAGTGQGLCQYNEHQKRAWSVDFSQADPTKFVSGSDDCSVKLWSINEKSSLGTIRSHANVCCVQFSSFSPHLLAFGSADYKVYCYDLRHARIPLCTLASHEKTVSYVKFLDSNTLLSASIDNTLKSWDLNKTFSDGSPSTTCDLTFTGHKNEKNFVGLSALDGYIACGSETNEVYCYYRSLPMPITSYKFGSVDPVSGHQNADENGLFVSSVCWRQKSNMLVAANSTGSIELLKLV
ncbi:SUPPRESSOR OF PHYA-105 1 [Hibiscus trionum]|uniref:SUPPRESSOR OF PHYA-105 1 n=1 Tax=Hibiscus trionum TaxID=183268 RepID=A0A9W7ING3_HIBTR|nr:SUPPRESSOR OF PHYA-105 1 [Hibiscus trionum]